MLSDYIVKGKVIKALSSNTIIILIDKTEDVRKVEIENPNLTFYNIDKSQIEGKSVIVKGKLIGDKIKIIDEEDGFEVIEKMNIIKNSNNKNNGDKDEENNEIFI